MQNVDLILAALRIDERNTEWMKDAACRHADPELFYPEDWQDKLEVDSNGYARRLGLPTMRQKMIEAAKAICFSCPVNAECLADANELEHNRNETHGIRAGMTRKERYDMREGNVA